jgi:mannose-6-phosphate isomerase-like protein (cupin superfamily)
MIVSTSTVEHYRWGESCDGWILSGGDDLLIIEELMPPNTAEVRHYHARARQFFYVLAGVLTMEVDGERHEVSARRGIEIRPGVAHQARNDGDRDVMFLVVSAPTSRGDRIAT